MAVPMTAAEPVAVMVKRWECPFCRRRHSVKKAAQGHMRRCWLNPAVRSCKTCANLVDEPGGEWCFPSQPCNCNDGHQECAAGRSFDDNGGVFPVTGCPLWRLREPEPETADA